MISKLNHHSQLKHFISTDENRPVWHRVYSFGEKAIHQPTLARQVKKTTGLSLMAETNQDEKRGKVTPEKLHGFITTSKVTPFTDGVCSWCQEEVKAGIPHTCAIITLFTHHVEEAQNTHDKLEQALQGYHKNV